MVHTKIGLRDAHWSLCGGDVADATVRPSLVVADEMLVRMLLCSLPPLRSLLGFVTARRFDETNDGGEFRVDDEISA
jgi:hypothetical protein